jgi:hypothetical protein
MWDVLFDESTGLPFVAVIVNSKCHDVMTVACSDDDYAEKGTDVHASMYGIVMCRVIYRNV